MSFWTGFNFFLDEVWFNGVAIELFVLQKVYLQNIPFVLKEFL